MTAQGRPLGETSQQSVAAIRALADEDRPAGPILHVLFSQFLIADPAAMDWLNRDRLLVSAGQCSATLFAVLHLAGYPVTIDDLRAIRRRHATVPPAASRGAVASSVSLAMTESIGGSRLNRANADTIDHRTFALVSAADLGSEAAEPVALAGLFALGKLIVFCDCSVTGPERADLSGQPAGLSPGYFAQCRWQVPPPVRACDLDGIELVTRAAITDTTRPALIRVEASARENVAGGPPGSDVPEGGRENWAVFRDRGARRRAAWNDAADSYHCGHPIGSAMLRRWTAQASGNPPRLVTGDARDEDESLLLFQELTL